MAPRVALALLCLAAALVAGTRAANTHRQDVVKILKSRTARKHHKRSTSHYRGASVSSLAQLEYAKELESYSQAVQQQKEVADGRFGRGDAAEVSSLAGATVENSDADVKGGTGSQYLVGNPMKRDAASQEDTQVQTMEKPVAQDMTTSEPEPSSSTSAVEPVQLQAVMPAPIKVVLIFYGLTETSWAEADKELVRKFVRAIPDVSAPHVNSVHNWYNLARLYSDAAGGHASELIDVEVEIGLTAAVSDLSMNLISSIIIDLIGRKQLPQLNNAVYAFLTSEDVSVSNGHGPCSWHHDGAVQLLWAGMPTAGSTCGPAIPDGAAYPGGRGPAVMVSEFARQLVNTVTDPSRSLDSATVFCSGYGVEQTDASDNVAYTHVLKDGTRYLLPQILNPATKECSSQFPVAPGVCGEAAYGLPCDLLAGNPNPTTTTTTSSGAATTNSAAATSGTTATALNSAEVGYDGPLFEATGKPLTQKDEQLPVQALPGAYTNEMGSTSASGYDAMASVDPTKTTLADLVVNLPSIQAKPDPSSFPGGGDAVTEEVLGKPLVVREQENTATASEEASVLSAAEVTTDKWSDAVEKPEAELEAQGKKDLLSVNKGSDDFPTTVAGGGVTTEVPVQGVSLKDTYFGQGENKAWLEKNAG